MNNGIFKKNFTAVNYFFSHDYWLFMSLVNLVGSQIFSFLLSIIFYMIKKICHLNHFFKEKLCIFKADNVMI